MFLKSVLSNLIYTTFIILFTSYQNFAQNSLIDQTFGNNGKIMPRYDKANSYSDDLQLDNKDRIVLLKGSNYPNGDAYVELTRYNINGQFDNTFSGDGKLLINLSTEVNENEYAGDILFTSDHKIYLTYHLGDGTLSIIKLNENGSFDNTFGTNGRLIINSEFSDFGTEIALTSDNKIIVVQDIRNDDYDLQNILIRKVNTNGSTDGSFGTAGGVLINNQSLDYPYEYIENIFVHPNGKITIFGESENSELLAIQFSSAGTRINQFGVDGQLVYDLLIGLEDQYYFDTYLLDKNGKFLLSGTDDYTSTILARFTENGIVDNTFGTNGIIKNVYLNGTRINYIATPSTSTGIWVGGAVKTQSRYQYSLGKLNDNGSVNTNFGSSGYRSYAISTQDAFGYVAYEQTDGKVILIGYSHGTDGYGSISCLRVLTNGVVDNAYGVAGVVYIPQVLPKNNDSPYDDATELQDMKVVADDAIIHTGIFAGGDLFGDGNGIYIAKQLANGNPDASFGTNGFVSITPMFGEETHIDFGGKLAVGNNKILTAFPTYDFFSDNTILLTQHTSNGQPDPGFGDNGRKILYPNSIQNEDFYPLAVEFLPNGKIVMLVRFYNSDDDDAQVEVIQLLANGTLDNSFSGDGRYTLPFYAMQIKSTNDNRIIVAGYQETASTDGSLAILKLTSAGVVDPAFNNGSIVLVSTSSGYDIPNGIIIESDNALTIGFTPLDSDSDFGIAKFNANGSPVSTWGNYGILVGSVDLFSQWQHFIRKSNGDYLFIQGESNEVSILKLSSTGAVDASYGTGGVGLITYTDVQRINISAVGLQQNGKLLIGGNESMYDDEFFNLPRDYASIVRVSASAATGPIIYTMTQPGNWSNAANWQTGQVPPNTITSNMEIIINPGGNGISTLDIPVTVQQGGKITVRPGKTFRAMANLTVPALLLN